MIPFLFALTISILLTLTFVIPGIFLFSRWIAIVSTNEFNTGDKKVPTFYSPEELEGKKGTGYIFLMSAAGLVFGGIHCAGWFFYFPSSDEAILWRVSSAVLTGSAFLLPLLIYLLYAIMLKTSHAGSHPSQFFVIAVLIIILLAYVASRLLLLVEAFISLRHLTPGMLALVKWTSFIPHI